MQGRYQHLEMCDSVPGIQGVRSRLGQLRTWRKSQSNPHGKFTSESCFGEGPFRKGNIRHGKQIKDPTPSTSHTSDLPCAEQVWRSLGKTRDFRFVSAAIPRTGVMTLIFPEMTSQCKPPVSVIYFTPPLPSLSSSGWHCRALPELGSSTGNHELSVGKGDQKNVRFYGFLP